MPLFLLKHNFKSKSFSCYLNIINLYTLISNYYRDTFLALPESPDLIAFLSRLFDTNTKFASMHDEKFFAKFHDSQNPTLTILKCSDSRVQMESFDKTPQNDVFAIRNIGNQIATSEGSIDFGIEVLNTPFLLIIGHSDCGAVTAVVNNIKMKSEFINKELSSIKVTKASIKDAIIENINYQVQKCVKKYESKINNQTLSIIGALYDFKNDFGFGYGKVLITSINGVVDHDLIKETYGSKIKNLNLLFHQISI